MKFQEIAKHRYFTAGILGVFSAVALGSYILASDWVYRTGFPLDDAWIHQTYARNLGSTGSWSFIPGQPSAGSTAPGWTILLALGYWLNLNEYFWTFFLGWCVLWLLSLVSTYGFRMLIPPYAKWGVFTGFVVIFEWHLTWAAGSGMETLLASLVALGVILLTIHLSNQWSNGIIPPVRQWLLTGVLAGLSVWIRPDGIALLGVVALTIVMTELNIKSKINAALALSIGFLLTTIPYLVFNQVLAGEFLPNTFFAKQAEYAVLRSIPIWERFFNIVQQPLTGVGILLLPGFIWFGIESFRSRKWAPAISWSWILGYLLVYAIRLPVSYQHGRYIMPVIPAYCLFSLVGMVLLIELISKMKFGRILKITWIISSGAILLVFWILGLRAYAMDVAVIESEMVDTATWVRVYTDDSSLVAAHDIGALGFYANRDLLDLAGLVSPEVIPIIRDESALSDHITEAGADYLVTFPGWYPDLVNKSELVYQTKGEFSPTMGGENMSVYEWEQH
jgi:hypothetical protein